MDNGVKTEKPPKPDTLFDTFREGDSGVWTNCPKGPKNLECYQKYTTFGYY